MQRQEEHERKILLAVEAEKERRVAAERQAREAEEEQERAFKQKQAILAAEQRQQLILAEEKEFQDSSYTFRLLIYLQALKGAEDREKSVRQLTLRNWPRPPRSSKTLNFLALVAHISL